MTKNWNFENKENYYPNIVLFHLGDDETLQAYDLDAEIKEYIKYSRIGSNNTDEALMQKGINELFLTWLKKDKKVLNSKKFFKLNSDKLKDYLKEVDISIIISKSNDIAQINYLTALNQFIFKPLDILSFNFVLRTSNHSKKSEKVLNSSIKLLKKQTRSQMIIIEERDILASFQNLKISNLKEFISKNFIKLVDSLISPFLRVVENPYLFKKLKYQIFTNEINSNLILSSLAISRKTENRLEDSLRKVLINPIFKSSFEYSKLLLVNIKGIFLEDKHKEKIENRLKEILGHEKEIIVTYFDDRYAMDRYTQISIFAFFVEKTGHTNKTTQLQNNLLNSKEEYQTIVNNLTEEILLR
ncbi:gliding machinery protein P42 [[Mycoplasma] mobile]|uniref:p42 expressed protein n=2 Tax=[Mycoplasma] mobile TaxID=2118 RepID=F8WJV7_MYCM1|nr:hypothetical protein [[Mycoplasma] mobile]AAT27591.1 P42 expressed protein [Mycoplasma mobile 163K]BAC23070.1 P42 [[Mycoplasma] mobile]